MNPEATHFQHASGGTASCSAFSLTPELAEKARIRVRRIAGFMALLGVIGLGLQIFFYLMQEQWAQDIGESAIGFGFGIGICLTVYLIARSTRFSNSAVLNLGLVFEVVMCYLAAFGTTQATYIATGNMPFMSWSTPLIILFPVIIPCPPGRMLLASIGAATADLAAVVVMWTFVNVPFEPLHFSVCINPSLAVVVAYFASRIIYGLNVDVTRAMQMGSYQLENRLGEGGMGEVWKASHRMLARPAAVKLIKPEALGSATDVLTVQKRFENEAQATASLRSPHTVQIYDFGVSQEGTFYYVMELLDGIDLNTLVSKHGPQAPERVVPLLIQACHSLHEAHLSELIHRDVKPANLFICRYGTDLDFLKVLDFGLVKESGTKDATMLTQHGSVIGTPGFLAPEMAMGQGEVDGRADLYALGCVAYYLLTGSLVFESDTPMGMALMHVKEIPGPPSARSELEIPKELDSIVMSCLEKEPDRRPRDAEALAEMLKKCPLPSEWSQARARKWWDLNRS